MYDTLSPLCCVCVRVDSCWLQTGKTWHNSVGYNPQADWSDLADFPSLFAWPGYYYDINNTDVSVQRIHHAASLQQPFLVAHGFIKPQ